MLTLIDEYTRECLAIDVARSLKSEDVLERLSDLFVRRGVPTYIRSDNGSEFTATKVREWLARVGVKTLFIEPGSPWENGYIESFNGKLRDELLAREQFDTLLEAKVLIERWRRHFNAVRPHSSLGYRAPAPQAIQPASLASATPQQAKLAESLQGPEPDSPASVRSDGATKHVSAARAKPLRPLLPGETQPGLLAA
jgi:putative transposase